MTQGIFIKRLNALRPTDDQSQEMLNKVKAGGQVRVEIKRMRNPRQFRLFWALMRLLADNADHPCTSDDVKDWVLKAVGHAYEAHYPDGTMEVKAKSIAFGNLPQDVWEGLFSKVLDFICTGIMAGTSKETLKAELEAMIMPGY